MNGIKQLTISFIFFTSLFQPLELVAESTPDSLLSEYQHAQNDSLKIEALRQIINFWKTDNPDSCIVYCKIMIREAKKIKNYGGGHKGYFGLVYNFGLLNYSDSALHYAFEAIEFSKICGLEHPPSVFFSFIGEQYRIMDQLDVALEYLLKSWEYAHKRGKTELYPMISNRIASVYHQMDNHNEALRWIDTSMMNGLRFKRQDYVLNNLTISGAINRDMGNYLNALTSFKDALSEAKKQGAQVDIPSLQNNIASTYDKLYEYDSVIKYALESYENSIPREIKSLMMVSTELLANSYAKRGDFEEAYSFLRIYEDLRQERFNAEHVKQISELNSKYETQEKEKQIEIHNINLAKKDLRIRQNTLTMYFFLILFIILIIFLVYMYFTQKKLKSANAQLSEKNKQIISQKLEIENFANEINTAYSKLQELDEHKQAMTSMIVHDLKNPLNILVNIDALDKEDQQTSIVQRSSKQMLNLVMNLLDISKAEENTFNLEKTEINLSGILQSAFAEVDFLCEQKKISIRYNSAFNYRLYADREILTRILINLLTNAIKFSRENGSVSIKSEIDDDKLLRVSVCDMGPGIEKKYHKIIFKKFKQLKKLKSGNIGSTGLGLAFCKMAVESHNWVIGVDSEPGKGSEFWIKINTYEIINQKPVKDEGLLQQPENNVFNTSPENLKKLNPYLAELSSLNIFAISEVKNVIREIENQKIEGLDQWLTELRLAAENFNEEKFANLINTLQK